MRPSVLQRWVAGAGGAVLLAGAVPLGGLTLFFAVLAHAPDALAPESDMCCSPPETWGELVEGLVVTFVAALLLALVVSLAVVLLVWAATERLPRVREVAIAPVGIVLMVAGVAAASLLPTLDEARPAPDCDRAQAGHLALRSRNRTMRALAALAVSRCRLVDGRTPDEVRERLGPPASVRRSDGWLTWDYGDALTIAFDGGRVESVITDR